MIEDDRGSNGFGASELFTRLSAGLDQLGSESASAAPSQEQQAARRVLRQATPEALEVADELLAAASGTGSIVFAAAYAVVAGETFNLRLLLGEALIVGRAGGAGRAAVARPEVSKDHVELTLRPEGLYARDLYSTNGTRVASGTIVELLDPDRPQRLRAGDVLNVFDDVRLCEVREVSGLFDTRP